MSSVHKNPYHAIYTEWNWRVPKWEDDFPFAAQPPINDPSRLARFLSGRDADIEKARDKLFDGNNIMVRGQWGIGKSAFILAVLQRLKEQSEVDFLPLYMYDFSGNDSESLYRHILLALAKGLIPVEKRAQEIYEALTGERATVTKGKTVKYGFNLQVVSASGEISEGGTKSPRFDLAKHHIDDLLTRAREHNLRVIIALDDLDKQRNQAAVWQMLMDSKALLRNAPCKFILTGRPLVANYVDFSAQVLELFDETFSLAPLDQIALRHAARGQLNLIRRAPREDVLPFEDETMEQIISFSSGIPRQFNKICRHALETARRDGSKTISTSLFENKCVPDLQRQISINIPYDVRRLLYYIHQKGSISLANEDDVDELLRVMQKDTLGEAISFLNDYVRSDWIVSREQDGRTHLTIAPLALYAAETTRQGKGQTRTALGTHD